MSAEEYNRILFERVHNEQRWKNQPADGWSIDDLDVTEIRNTVAEAVRVGRLNEPGTREPDDLLRGLGLLRDGVLFRAAAVLFGSTERLECDMPQCLLREIRSLAGQQTNERRLREDLAILKSKRLAKSSGRGRGARWKPM